MTNYNFPPEIQGWIDIVELNVYATCNKQKALMKHVKKCFAEDDIYIDIEQLNNYMKICSRYIPFELLPWEKFIIALHDCTYWTSNNEPRWPILFVMTGRGNGKDGCIAAESFCVSSPYNHIKEYDVDICANNEEQAMRPVEDLTGWLDDEASHNAKIKNFYYWTKQIVTSKKTRAKIKGRTNNPKGRDGMRSGLIVFNEVHQYENYDNINVFKTGLGKKANPRESYYTTNGEVREGPLDDLYEQAENIFSSDSTDDDGCLFFICELDAESDIDNPDFWCKANPSLPYFPHLKTQIANEYKAWKRNPMSNVSFPNKRMNIKSVIKENAVTKWDNIKATNKPIPDLTGWDCTVGIDFSKTTDMVSVNAHFKNGEQRYDISKSWLCSACLDLERIKAPWKVWIKQKHLEWVDDVEIHPDIVANYIKELGKVYNIKMVAIDTYRYTLLSDALAKVGISKQNNNLMLVRQQDILRIAPVIEHLFTQQCMSWGDNPVLRWATNNTKVIPYGKQQGADKGSFVYAKIEAKSRKTDPFMALVASVCAEGEITQKVHRKQLPIITF